MVPELMIISVMEQEIVMNQSLTWNDTEEVNQSLGGFADMGTNGFSAGGGIEDGEIDVGIGVSRMEEATKTDGIGSIPELENTVDIEEVLEEATVLVPTLAGADRTEDGDERREILVN